MIDSKFIEENRMYPLLIMGDAVTDFKKNYKGPIITIQDMDSLRDFISYYGSINYLDRPIVLEDLSFLPQGSEGYLLKFVEESKLDLILISRFDRVSPVLLSRIKNVQKYYKDKIESQFLSASKGSNLIEDTLSKDSHYYDKVRYMGKYAPKLIFLEKKIRVTRNKNKIMSFMD